MTRKPTVPIEVSEYMKAIGAKGGKASKGKKKTRDPSHYQALIAARRKAREKRAKLKASDA